MSDFTPKRIYLAGKIGKNDWRHSIVKGLREAINGACPPDVQSDHWPILQRAIFNRFDYVGPYFTSCDHGCWHGEGSHGNGSQLSSHYDDSNNRHMIVARCERAINSADLVFVWLDSRDAYGTIAELGYAWGVANTRTREGKDDGLPEVFIASPSGFDPNYEMWLPFYMSHRGGVVSESPRDALRNYLVELEWFFDSPLESQFWYAWLAGDDNIPLEIQHEVMGGRYRLDFAHLPTKTAIEVDGFTYHSDRKQFERDRKRDRELSEAGWRVIRFAGQEIMSNAHKCVAQAARLIKQAMA